MVGTFIGLATTSISLSIGASVTCFGFEECEHHVELVKTAIKHYSDHYESEVQNLNNQFKQAFHNKMSDYYELSGRIEILNRDIEQLNLQLRRKDSQIEELNSTILEKDLRIERLINLSGIGTTVGITST